MPLSIRWPRAGRVFKAHTSEYGGDSGISRKTAEGAALTTCTFCPRTLSVYAKASRTVAWLLEGVVGASVWFFLGVVLWR